MPLAMIWETSVFLCDYVFTVSGFALEKFLKTIGGL